MIVIRFGLWPRQYHGQWEYHRVYLWGVPVPLCRREPRSVYEDDGDFIHEISPIKSVGMKRRQISALTGERRKGKR